jgi:hypothetical protein
VTPETNPSLPDIVGGVAAALAIAAALLGAIRWLYRHHRRNKLLDRLRTEVRELDRLDRLLGHSTMQMDQLFTKGFPWAGYAIFDGEMGDHLNTLQQIAGQTADLAARVRALNAQGADERLRGDIEGVAQGLRQVTPLYIWGIVDTYRRAGTDSISTGYGNDEESDDLNEDEVHDTDDIDNEDEGWSPMMVQIPLSATGREPTRVLKFEHRSQVRDLRLDLRVLFRSIVTRLDMDDLKHAPFASWPIDTAESYQDEAELRAHLTIPYES